MIKIIYGKVRFVLLNGLFIVALFLFMRYDEGNQKFGGGEAKNWLKVEKHFVSVFSLDFGI